MDFFTFLFALYFSPYAYFMNMVFPGGTSTVTSLPSEYIVGYTCNSIFFIYCLLVITLKVFNYFCNNIYGGLFNFKTFTD